MIEHNLSWLMYVFVAFMLIVGIVSISAYGISIAHFNEYEKEVQKVVQKEGGLTPKAQHDLNVYSEQHFDGQFVVKSLSGTQKKVYGTPIHYEITGNLEFPIFNLSTQKKTVKGSTVSLVRG